MIYSFLTYLVLSMLSAKGASHSLLLQPASKGFLQGIFRVPSATQASACVTFSLVSFAKANTVARSRISVGRYYPKTWMQKDASKLGHLLKKSSTFIFLLPSRSALLICPTSFWFGVAKSTLHHLFIFS